MRLQHLSGLFLVSFKSFKVISKELKHVVDSIMQIFSLAKLEFAHISLKIVVDHVVLQLKVFFREFLHYLFDGQLVDLSVGIQPPQLLVKFNKDTIPVGGDFKFVFG